MNRRNSKGPITKISEHTAIKKFKCPITGDIIQKGQFYKRLTIKFHGTFACSALLENEEIEEFAERKYYDDLDNQGDYLY